MEWLKEHWFKLGILLILLLTVILLAYYFMVFTPQQEAAQQAAVTVKNDLVAFEKEGCVTQAQKLAISEYESSAACTGAYASSDCTDGSTYLMPQYTNAYDTCLQSDGLQ